MDDAIRARLTPPPPQEALRYLGWRGGELPEAERAELARCMALLLQTARPRLVWRRFLLPMGEELAAAAAGSGDVQKLLRGCRAAVLFAATLGREAEALLRRAQRLDMAQAVILDACESACIETVCDNFCADLAQREAPLRLTRRFSPGYGDLPLERQKEFCALLDAERRIGVSLTPSGLLLPQKTVTALLGLSPGSDAAPGGCQSCDNRESCPYRKGDASCEIHP